MRAHRPGLIINAAAHTAVDLAESEPDAAFAINAIAPGNPRRGSQGAGYPADPLLDRLRVRRQQTCRRTPKSDTPNPLGVYGQSKLAGEQAIAAVGGQYLILRTSWVYSSHGKNFLLTMQRLLQEKPQMRIVADQIGAPTWAGTIANSTRVLIEQWQAGKAGDWGVYHLTAQG